jgi:hypothetical protein
MKVANLFINLGIIIILLLSQPIKIVVREAYSATGYGLEGPRIESRWGRDFPHLSRPALGPIQSPVQWVPGPSRG